MSKAEDYVYQVALSVSQIFKFRFNTVDANLLKSMPENLKAMILSHQEQPNLRMLVELHKKIIELTGTNTYMVNGQVVPKNVENFDWDNLKRALETVVDKYKTEESKVVAKRKTNVTTSSFLSLPNTLHPEGLKMELNMANKTIDKNASMIKKLSTPARNPGPSS